MHTFTRGRAGVDHLDAPYRLLASAFGNDGTVDPRDADESLASWDVRTPAGLVRVYHYGPMPQPEGYPLGKLTHWHVKGEWGAVRAMLEMLDAAAFWGKVSRADQLKLTESMGDDSGPGASGFGDGAVFGKTIVASWLRPEDRRTIGEKRADLARFFVETFEQIDDEETLLAVLGGLEHRFPRG